MQKITGLALAVTAVIAALAAPATTVAMDATMVHIRGTCEDEWPGNAREYERCVQDAQRTVDELSHRLREHARGTPERRILDACMDEWRDFYGHMDYHEALRCWQERNPARGANQG
ncbi:hypothetical protein TVNIR_0505 [Thioalkalivibrio nitratireducens DSM 14787]|uniref:Lipoprotein n=1 Tax=Thioalkalivibrio nitratireducens (strain DSM 14787 / UNIQEM 213 / ALEN2) TaxID=1255043 RepID=L0DT88_THIND|nr:hypothetical protein [Thioalkalivibrio nitratireducens]AGA32207.1 hypothetical protein TVNIR_0505 [Thioalkalivibrio nitratireducens DSM 14787]